MEKRYETVRFEEGGVTLDVSVSPQEDTVWLTQEQMAQLFLRDQSVVARHIRNIFAKGELEEKSVHAKFAYTGTDGKTYLVSFYNLDVIIAVGYRVNSPRGVLFRKWASSVLREYLLRGYAISGSRALANEENFRGLLQKVKEIDGRLETLESVVKEAPPERIFYEGQLYDAFAFLSSLISEAKMSVILVDGYADDRALSFLAHRQPNVSLDLYLSKKTRIGAEAFRRFISEYGPLALHETEAFHDRYLILDHCQAYAIGASLNQAGKKAFGVYKITDERILTDLLSLVTSP
jgi:hypothetical protein